MKEEAKILFWIYLLHCLCNVSPKDIEHRKRRSAKEDFHQHEVIKPILYSDGKPITTTRIQGGHLSEFHLVIPTRQENISVELKLNRNLFSSLYIEKYYTSEGEVILHPTDHNTTGHCYYHGNIKDHVSSIAAVSTCDGISGMIVGEHEVFHIVPEEPAVISGPHLLFRGSHQKTTNHSCGVKDHQFMPDISQFVVPKHNRLKRNVHWPYDSNLGTKIVELYVANDNLQYTTYEKDKAKVIARTKDIINVASSLYKKVNTHLALVGVEIWMESDPISIVENADTTMNNFLAYRRSFISPVHKNDNAQLITGHTFGQGVIGKAPINTICSWQYSGGVNMDHSPLVGPVATTVAHEMGHNFGLAHDIDECSCPDKKCIMNSNSGGTRPTHWSSCSMEQFADSFHVGMDYCLHDMPESLYGSPVCGNGFLEEGEQCDCGTVDSCESKCCDAATCTLLPNASCATGKCCNLNTCQLVAASTICRVSADTCDLPEYCHGDSEHCPSDAYNKDGTECSVVNTQSYCYQGRCRSRESQCQKLWGVTGHDSIPRCYEHFNVMGVANGHCGFNWINKTFMKCPQQDIFCGMLQCTHTNEKLMFWKEALSYTMPEGWVIENNVRHDCYGAILDVGLDYQDPGMVPHGAKCGANKLCVHEKCLAIDSLGALECPDCNNHGVCNHLGQCHCDVGFAPPDCKYAGDGGSLHSGPIKVLGVNVALVIGMVIFFVVCLPLILLLIFCLYKHREEIKQQWPVHSTFSKKYSSICREPTPQFDSSHQSQPPVIHKPTRTAPVIPRALSFNKPKPSVTANGVKRTPSFRPEDITQVKLESTTNKQVDQLEDLPVRYRSPTLDAARIESIGHRYSGQDFDPRTNNSTPSVGAHGSSGGMSPGRPPLPLKYQQTHPQHDEEPIRYENVGKSRFRDPPPPPYDSVINSSTTEPPPVLPPRPSYLRGGSTETATAQNEECSPSVTAPNAYGKTEADILAVASNVNTNKKSPQHQAQPAAVGTSNVSKARSKFESSRNPAARVPPSNTGIKPPPAMKPTSTKKPPSQTGTSGAAGWNKNSSASSGKKPQLKPKPSLNLKDDSPGSVDC